jgi:hypothetical protein
MGYIVFMPKFIDFSGLRFGRWTVLSRASDYLPGVPQWLCLCSCGTKGVVRANILKSGQSQSCGCYMRERSRQLLIERTRTHGLTDTPTHDTWCNMRARCEKPSASGYAKYGAKGIRVCERWQRFENFLVDMGERPSPKHTIERKNSRGNYEPDNCVWATMKQQQNNRTNNRRITWRGETLTLMQWAERLGIPRERIAARIDRLGWSVERALSS